MVIPGGLEPPTPCLEGRCSIQLSYGTIMKRYLRALIFGRLIAKIIAVIARPDGFATLG